MIALPRSFFVGPTAWFKGRERRHVWRWLHAIIRKGDTEPLELITVVQMIGNGTIWLLVPNPSAVIQPPWLGWTLLATAAVGGFGLFTRKLWPRCLFGFIGVFIRVWITMFYFQKNWAEPIWWSYLLGASVSGWIAARVLCDIVLRKEFLANRP